MVTNDKITNHQSLNPSNYANLQSSGKYAGSPLLCVFFTIIVTYKISLSNLQKDVMCKL